MVGLTWGITTDQFKASRFFSVKGWWCFNATMALLGGGGYYPVLNVPLCAISSFNQAFGWACFLFGRIYSC